MRLTWTSILKDRLSPSSISTTSIQVRLLSPLDIPLILERILFFLDQRTLCRARLTCKHWNDLSQKFVQRWVEWDYSANSKRRAKVLKALGSVTHLVCRLNTPREETENNTNGDNELVARLAAKCEGDSSIPPLRELFILSASFNLDENLLGLLPSVQHLTRLVLRTYGYVKPAIWFRAVFETCQGLISFELGSGEGPIILEALTESESAKHFPNRIFDPLGPFLPSSPLKLRSLVLEQVSVHQSYLEQILLAMPHLTELRIISLHRNAQRYLTGLPPVRFQTEFDPTRFIQFLRGLEIGLSSFHFSMADRKLSIENTQELLDHYCPIVKRLGIFAGDLDARMAKVLVEIPNRITSLDIASWVGSGRHTYSSGGLHAYLCDSPSLLHLRAGKLPFNIHHLDINYTLPSWEFASSILRHTKDSTGKKKVWACRGLKTLQLVFTIPHQSWTLMDGHIRIICGYIVRMCPQLRDFETDSTCYADLHLPSGLCILARLEHLERLSIRVADRWTLGELDLDWMMKRQSIWRVIQRKRYMAKCIGEEALHLEVLEEEMKAKASLKETSSKKEVVLPAVAPRPQQQQQRRAKSWEDRSHIGRLRDVKMVLDEINKGLLRNCWPSLRTLEVCYWQGPFPVQMAIQNTLQELRPAEFLATVEHPNQ